MSKKRLGRGLDALLSAREQQPVPTERPMDSPSSAPAATAGQAAALDGLIEVAVDSVQPSPYQPRRHFEEEALKELAESITTSGLLQPIVVRLRASGDYELIAGERRLRAAQLAGLSRIPALQRSVSDQDASALALIENVQREDLSALEEALGLARLRDEFELTQQQIADAVGKSRVAIANLLRLLNLGSVSRQMLENGDLEMGHARALLGLEGAQQDAAAHQVAEQGLSVRQTEALVRKISNGIKPRDAAPAAPVDADTQRLEQRLMDHLGAPVAIKHSNKGLGQLVIRYSNLDELQGILEHLGLEQE